MADRMPTTMSLPNEFRELFEWMDTNGYFMPSVRYPGDKLGLLGSENELEEDYLTAILFRVETPQQARANGRAWFGDVVPNVEERLVAFARTGSDGSCAAFWLDDEGRRQIVHLGSEGLVCMLSQTPLDFLRLLAIGYWEISACLETPTEPPDQSDVNVAFRSWLIGRYGVTIPDTASEILSKVPDVLAEVSDDPFWRWVRRNQNERDRRAASETFDPTALG